MAAYESTFIARPDISKQEVDKIEKTFSDLVKNSGGKVIKSEYWGLRDLAYDISKHKRAHYLMLGVQTSGDVLKEMQRKAGLNDDILRNVNIKVDEISKEPSAMMKSGRREDVN